MRLYSHLDAMQSRLKDHDWLALDRTTIADIACYPCTASAPDMGLKLEDRPGVAAWVKRCAALPGWPQDWPPA